VAAVFEREGADAWFTRDVRDLVPAGTACPKCKGSDIERETDILDVWFDSGVSFAAVVEKDFGAGTLADLYLEGSDQHRGWFHSSLLTSVATREHAPYKAVLTHGFVLDGEGRKQSKSLGNVVAPQEVIKQYGADILRLWVSAEDYRDDVRISEEILKRLADSYRRVRNTARNMLANLYDFDPATGRRRAGEDAGTRPLGAHAACGIGRALDESLRGLRFPSRLPRAQQLLRGGFERALLRHREGPPVLRRPRFAGAPLHSDRHARDAGRAHGAHRADPVVHGGRDLGRDSRRDTFGERLPRGFSPGARRMARPRARRSAGTACGKSARRSRRRWKSRVPPARSGIRSTRASGSAVPAADLPVLEKLGTRELEAVFIVSQVELVSGPKLAVEVVELHGRKCGRCWNYREDVGAAAAHPEICGRCAAVVAAA
jgi:isoleucyl-tRNA synthetase